MCLEKEDFQLVGMKNRVSLHKVLSVDGKRSLVKLVDRHYCQESLSLVLYLVDEVSAVVAGRTIIIIIIVHQTEIKHERRHRHRSIVSLVVSR